MSTLAGSWPFDANGAPVDGIESAAWHYGNGGSASAAYLKQVDELLWAKLDAQYQNDNALAQWERRQALRWEP